jgi:hypothetical protein
MERSLDLAAIEADVKKRVGMTARDLDKRPQRTRRLRRPRREQAGLPLTQDEAAWLRQLLIDLDYEDEPADEELADRLVDRLGELLVKDP